MSDPPNVLRSAGAAKAGPPRTRVRPSRRVLLAIVLGVLCVFAAGVGFELSRLAGPPAAAESFAYRSSASPGGSLPELWRVPAFSFPDQHEASIGPGALAGQVWIADFIFTTCTSVCPVLCAKMVMLQQQLRAPGLRFVSFSVDPEHDRPEVLARYAELWNPGESRWLLLSTDASGLASIADGMHVAVAPTGDAQNPILHSSLFFLVDQRGSVRGIYDSADDEALRRLVVDASGLLGAPPAGQALLEGTGQPLFAALGCAACHDNDKLAPPLLGLLGREVALTGGDRVKADTPYLRESIVAPGRQLVAGYLNIMPSYASVLSGEQIDGLVSYLGTLSAPATVNPPGPVAAGAMPVAPLVAAAAGAAAAVSTDPVCQMQVRVSAGTPHVEHEGHSYYFCSETCRAAFAADPTKYLH